VRPLDLAVIAAYFVAVAVAGILLGGQQRDAGDYFLGRRGLPWWAIMLSIVATETSALTIISVPGIAARGDLTFLQLSFGYLVGRVGVAALLLPGYFDGPGNRLSAIGAALWSPRATSGRGDLPAHPRVG
jgi:SSS family solute:Na+ symporter